MLYILINFLAVTHHLVIDILVLVLLPYVCSLPCSSSLRLCHLRKTCWSRLVSVHCEERNNWTFQEIFDIDSELTLTTVEPKSILALQKKYVLWESGDKWSFDWSQIYIISRGCTIYPSFPSYRMHICVRYS